MMQVMLPTLSRMTKGPLTPPMVLYLILGCILVMRGSSTLVAIAEVQRGFQD